MIIYSGMLRVLVDHWYPCETNALHIERGIAEVIKQIGQTSSKSVDVHIRLIRMPLILRKQEFLTTPNLD